MVEVLAGEAADACGEVFWTVETVAGELTDASVEGVAPTISAYERDILGEAAGEAVEVAGNEADLPSQDFGILWGNKSSESQANLNFSQL